jgi:hypothetical protein
MSATTKAAAAIAAAALVGVGLKWGHDKQAGEVEEPCIANEAVVETDGGYALELILTCGAKPDGGILPEGVHGRAFAAGKEKPRPLAKGVHRRSRAEAEWECAVRLPGASCEELAPASVFEAGDESHAPEWIPAPVCETLYRATRGDCTPAPCHAPSELGPDSAMPEECLTWMEGERVKANEKERREKERREADAGDQPVEPR